MFCMLDTTPRPSFIVADIYGWTRDLPTYAAACRAALNHAVATGIPTFVEGAHEDTFGFYGRPGHRFQGGAS
jgi:hypothetical protein